MSETQSRRRPTDKPSTDGRPAGKTRSAPPAERAERAEPRTNVRRALVEAQIYEHATRLFAERGFAATTLQDIADAVGLTRPALYHYVSNKDELLAKLVAEITEDSAAGMAAIAQRTDLPPDEQLRQIVAGAVRRQGEHADRFRLLILSENDLPEQIASVHAAGRRAVLRTLTTVIERGVAQGVFRPVEPRIAALGVLGMSNWVAWWYSADGRTDLDRVSVELADQAVAGLTGGAMGKARVDNPRAAIRQLRGDLDHLERMIDS